MSTTIESLELQVQSSSQSAQSGLDALTNSLSKLKSATKGGIGLTAVVNQVNKLNSSMNNLSSSKIANLKDLVSSLSGLKSLQGVKVSSTIAKSITEIGNATSGLNSEGVTMLRELAPALNSLSSIGNVKISSTVGKGIASIVSATNSINVSELSKIKELADAVSSLASIRDVRISSSIATQVVNLAAAAELIQGVDLSIFGNLAEALVPLSTVERANLNSTINQLKKIPEVATALNMIDLDTFSDRISRIASALQPLATQMNAISSGFAAFPQRIQTLITSTNSLTTANNSASSSYMNLYARLKMASSAVRGIASKIAAWIENANSYIEDINLFNASMGQFAKEATNYANKVADVMGIDPGEWMRNQGVFMTLADGFGVAGDRAYTMSQQLTQLGYDLSSFFNITVADAMQKLQSGLAGELEPLRRLGYDLSQARLEAIALSLGIDKTYTSMIQAEKSQLRYYAIMTQVTTAQGDMARTLDAPANQLRVLQAQVTQAARAFGSVFIPILNAVLPVVIAVAKAIRILASAIASLFGFSLPDVDYSGITDYTGGVGDLGDALDSAGGSAKKLKSYLMGFDELNVINPNDSSGGGSGGGGGGGSAWDWDLPVYDFLGDAVSTRVDAIFNHLKPYVDWIIENFDDLLATVGAIGAGLLAWKITNQVTDGVGVMSKLATWFAKNKMGIGIGLTITSAVLAFKAGFDWGYEGTTLPNVIKAVGANLGAFIGGCTVGGLAGGVLALCATLLITLTGVALGVHKKQVEEDLRNRFGDISLTVEEVMMLVQKQIDQGLIDSIKLYLEIDTQLSENLKAINETQKVLNFFNWKVDMGLALTSGEVSEYKSTIDSYVSDCLQYVEDRGYKIDIALRTAFPDQVDENGQIRYLGNAMVTQLLSDELTQLGTELQTIVNQAFDNDGLLDIDEKAAVERIMGEMNKIMEMVSKSKVEAKLAMIDLEYGGAQLTEESYIAYVTELGSLKSTLVTDAKTVIEGTIADLTLNLEIAESYLTKDPDNEEYQEMVAQCERELNDYLAANPLQAKIDEINLTIEQRALTGWEKLFGDLFDQVTPSLSEGMTQWMSYAFNPENIDEETLESLRSSGADILNYIYQSDAIAENFSSYLSDMLVNAMGAERYEIVAESAVKLEITDWEWKVLDDTIQFSLYQQMSEAFGAKATKEAFEQLGYDLTGVIAEGVKNADSIIEDSAGDIVLSFKDGTKISLGKNDSTMIAMFKALGIDLVDGMILGVDDEMNDTAKKIAEIFGIPYEKAAEENQVNSPSKLFKQLGIYIVEGLMEGLGAISTKLKNTWTNLPTWFQNMVNIIVSKFTGMSVDVGELFDDTKGTIQSSWSTSSFSIIGLNAIKGLVKGLGSEKIPDLEPAVKLVKSGWTTVTSWVHNLFGSTNNDERISLIKSGWTTVTSWVHNLFGSTNNDERISLIKSGWTTVTSWVHNLFGSTNNDERISLIKSGWTTVTSWVKSYAGVTDLTQTINLKKGTWFSLPSTKTADYTINLKKGTSLGTKIKDTLSSIFGISLWANGGFPTTGQMFIAREAGPELVGNIGGRSAVANNDQIVEAVSMGVYQAVSAAMSSGGDGDSTRITINLDGEKIYENQQKIARNRGYDLGMGAFSHG